MGFTGRRRAQRFSRADAVALLPVVACLVAAGCWVRHSAADHWSEASARIVSTGVAQDHYNAEDTRAKVSVTYQYEVGDTAYTGTWQGLWPETGSPNALLPHELNRLREPGHLLSVRYDPRNPGNSRLHFNSDPEAYAFAVFFAASGLALLYVLFLFPSVARRLKREW